MTLTFVDMQGVRVVHISLVSLDSGKRGLQKSVKRADRPACQTGFPPQGQRYLQPSPRTAGRQHIFTHWPAHTEVQDKGPLSNQDPDPANLRPFKACDGQEPTA